MYEKKQPGTNVAYQFKYCTKQSKININNIFKLRDKNVDGVNFIYNIFGHQIIKSVNIL